MKVKHIVRVQLELRATVNLEGDETMDAVKALETELARNPQQLWNIFGPALQAAANDLGMDLSDKSQVSHRILDSYVSGMMEYPVSEGLPVEYEPRKKFS